MALREDVFYIAMMTDANFSGKWKWNHEWATVEFSIARSGESYSIEAIDTTDGEKIVVANIRHISGHLKFDALCESNGYRASYDITAASDDTITCRIRTLETQTWIQTQ